MSIPARFEKCQHPRCILVGRVGLAGKRDHVIGPAPYRLTFSGLPGPTLPYSPHPPPSPSSAQFSLICKGKLTFPQGRAGEKIAAKPNQSGGFDSLIPALISCLESPRDPRRRQRPHSADGIRVPRKWRARSFTIRHKYGPPRAEPAGVGVRARGRPDSAPEPATGAATGHIPACLPVLPDLPI